MARTVGILMNKGGSGKTSFVTNVAGAIHLTYPDKKVLIVDADGQGNASFAFGKNPDKWGVTLYDVLVSGVPAEEAVVNLMENLDLLPANSDMNLLEFQILPNLRHYPNPFLLMDQALQGLKEKYDYIFIDSPPSMGLVAGNIIMTADDIYVPFVPEPFAVQGLIKVLETIQDFKKQQKAKARIAGVIGMMFDPRTKLHHDLLLQARIYCDKRGLRLLQTRVHRTVEFAKSTAKTGLPAVLVDKNNPHVKVYFDLMKEVLA